MTFRPLALKRFFQVTDHVQRVVFFQSENAMSTPILSAVTRIEHHRTERPQVGNHGGPQTWLDSFGQVETGNELLTIPIEHREGQPLLHAIDVDLARIVADFQPDAVIPQDHTVLGKARMGLQSVETRDVIKTEIIAAVDLDDLPIVAAARIAVTAKTRRIRCNAVRFKSCLQRGNFAVFEEVF